jgi:hypothetical protein
MSAFEVNIYAILHLKCRFALINVSFGLVIENVGRKIVLNTIGARRAALVFAALLAKEFFSIQFLPTLRLYRGVFECFFGNTAFNLSKTHVN